MKKYYIVICIIILVVAVFSSDVGAMINTLSPLFQGLIMLAFVVPTEILLYFISKEEKIKSGFKTAAKIGMVFLAICYVGGFLAELFIK